MPQAAARVCTLMPLHMPRAVTMAGLRPRAIPCVKTKILSGPGATVSATEALRK